MVEKLLLEIYLPQTGCTYEVRLPAGLNVRAAAALVAMLLDRATEGIIHASPGYMLYSRAGKRLNPRNTLWEEGIRCGTQLMLI